MRGLFVASILLMLLPSPTVAASFERDPPLSIHPENPKYFLFRGKPLVLVTATEHYGSVINRRFDFQKYLSDAAAKHMTLTRTFLLFRELQTPRNPYSPCKPESPDYVAPYPRTGPGKALDGEPIYDLDRWNPEYFERLHRFLSKASERGIVVELTLFSNTYADNVWALNPLRSRNNKQSIGKVEWPDYTSTRDKDLLERQMAYVRKIVQETSKYDNVYYEICNEASGSVARHATHEDVDAWQELMAHTIREELKKLNRRHLVFGPEAFRYAPRFEQSFDKSFAGTMLDAVNCHPLPGLTVGGHAYDLGHFMSKELKLGQVRDFCLAAQRTHKPCVLDEDNVASMYRDMVGWTIHRKRAWTAILSGAHYDYIDFSVTVGNEAGTAESRQSLRTWMKHLSDFIHGFDFVHAQPLPGWITSKPDHMVVATLAVQGTDYVSYLADAREVTDADAGQALEGKVVFSLPNGRFSVRLYSPTTGMYSPGILLDGGKDTSLPLPQFRHDIVLRATRVK